MTPLGLRRDIGARRLSMIIVLVAAMLLTLLARLYYVQILDPNKPRQTAGALHDGVIVVPAPRGLIVDANGRPLVDNTPVEVMTIDHERLEQLPDHGASVLRRVGDLIGVSSTLLGEEITPCSPTVSAPCWVGEPYQPVPVIDHVPTSVVLAVSEHRERFPGVAIETETEPHYPGGTLASHILGYTGQVTAADIRADPSLHDADTIGKSGLEASYDQYLRGSDGQTIMQLTPQGYAAGRAAYHAPVQGDTLVTSIDGRLQALVEKSLAEQITESRAAGEPATSGAVVAMDPQTGRVLAVASYPTYNPSLFVGGISDKNYARLTSAAADDPLLSRAIAGQYAPGSTFKLVTSSSLVMHHEISLTGTYPCPGSVAIDGRVKTNYDSESFPYPLSLRDALGYSCDTFFYVPAANEYYADQNRIAHGKKPHEWLQQMAREYGVATSPNIDLPSDEQAPGSYADRETRMARWKQYRKYYCAEAKRGYPEIKKPSERAYLTQLASENCTDGWRYRAGDNADMSIGQGETTVSPLQLAVMYCALVNGGRIWEPTIGRAIVDPSGRVVKTIDPTVRNRVPVKQHVLDYIANSLNFGRGYAVSGAFAYLDSPYASRIGGKTGTAEVYGHKDTSWLASWGPVYHVDGHVRARFVLVGMIEQGGTGATAAGPMLKRIWDALLGADGHPPLLPGERPKTSLPTRVDGHEVTAR